MGLDVIIGGLATLLTSVLVRYAREIAPRVIQWFRSHSRARDAVAIVLISLGTLALIASGWWVDGWWEAFLLEVGTGFIFVGLIEIVVLAAIE